MRGLPVLGARGGGAGWQLGQEAPDPSVRLAGRVSLGLHALRHRLTKGLGSLL